jgi:hypothetical protein
MRCLRIYSFRKIMDYETRWSCFSFDYVQCREGFERGGNQEFTQYLYVAKASCGEVRSQLYVALDQEYVDQKTTDDLLAVIQRLSVMIKHLIDHLKRSGMRGPKYGNLSQPTPSGSH